MLVKQLEDEHPGDFARLALLGALYEETGDAAKAHRDVPSARSASTRAQIDLRLRMIRLLQAQGELDKAIAEYEGLIRAAPNNPQFVFEECEALLQRGDRARALQAASTELEARAGERRGGALARRRLLRAHRRERAVAQGAAAPRADRRASDPAHLVDLGDRYFQDGNAPLAVQTWKRILDVGAAAGARRSRRSATCTSSTT